MTENTRQLIQKLEENIGKAVLGKSEVVRLCLVALLAGEHILLEDVPGVGKTLIGKALAKSIEGSFGRIQFTPDLLPADITGSNIYDSREHVFSFVRGPLFSNIVLADEINRTTPRTQSALLEAMGESHVSADGETHALPAPFMVIATQNPMEFEGTYPLPESQFDRFLMRISVGYPERIDEIRVLTTHREGEPVDRLESVVMREQILEMQKATREVKVDESINHYLMDVVEATRNSDDLHVGVSTRGLLAWYRACQAFALVEGRDYVVPDDAKRLAIPVLSHRVISKGYLHGGHREATESLVASFLEKVDAPS